MCHSENDKNFFNDEECRLNPRNIHVWAVMFISAYLVMDTLVILLR